MHRRDLLGSAGFLTAGALAPVFLQGCASSAPGSSGITITQSMVDKVTGIISGLQTFLGNPSFSSILGSAAVKLSAFLGDAQVGLGKLQSAVGQVFSIANVQAIFASLGNAASLVASFFPGNPILAAIQTVLPLLAAAWQIIMPAGATVMSPPMSEHEAMGLLLSLPRPSAFR